MQINIRKIRGKECKNCFDLMGDLFYFMTFVYLFPCAFVGKICMCVNRKSPDMPNKCIICQNVSEKFRLFLLPVGIHNHKLTNSLNIIGILPSTTMS